MYRSVIMPGILLRKKAMKGVNYYQYLKLHPKDGLREELIGWYRKRTGTSFDNEKGRAKD